MPFYRHRKGEPTLSGIPYESRKEASEGLEPGWMVSFEPSETERTNWREREQRRFDSGEYVVVPWDGRNLYPDHYVHLSIKTPGLVAYTASEEKGIEDRQTSIRPGKYLEQFYTEEVFQKRAKELAEQTRSRYTSEKEYYEYYLTMYRDWYTPERVAEYITKCQAQYLELHFAVTPDEIEAAYRKGPSSCMAHERGCYTASEHPVRVYGNSDLQVAYLGDLNKSVTARAVVWPEKKRYWSFYGQEQVLQALLRAQGYTEGSFTGAKVRAIPYDGTWIMPYIDSVDYADLSRDRKWFILGDGDYGVKSAEGTVEYSSSYTCAREDCDNEVEEDGSYCDSCYRARWTCYDCGEEYFTDDDNHPNAGLVRHVYYGGGVSYQERQYCNECYEKYERTCEHCQDRFYELDLTRDQQERRIEQNRAILCLDCDTRGVVLHGCCSEWFESDDRCECQEEAEAKADQHAEEQMAWEGATQ